MPNNFVTLDDINVKSKKVLVRVDLNVPMKNGKIENYDRIIRSSPTIKELVEKGAKVIVLTHLGRPEGNGYQEEFSVKPLVRALGDAIKKTVAYVNDCIGDPAKNAIARLQDGDVLMLENVRFYKAETKNDLAFTKKLAELADVYVSDAFSASHRAHSSTEGLAHLLPYAAGRLMQEELEALQKALGNPKKPVVAIVGGAKVSTKLDVLNNLVKKVDYVIIGGAMANTFLNATGVDVGESMCEHEMKENCLNVIATAKAKGCQLVLPVDARVGLQIDNPNDTKFVLNGEKLGNYKIFDAGNKSVDNFIEVIKSAKTVIWNGPVGAFEFKPFEEATFALAKEVASLCKSNKLIAIAGGGDTVSALELAGVASDLTYVSTAGGAFLEWMEGKDLPGVMCLLKK